MSDTVHPLVAQFCTDLIADVAQDRAERVERAAAKRRHPSSQLPSPPKRVAEFDDRNDATVIDLFTGRRQS